MAGTGTGTPAPSVEVLCTLTQVKAYLGITDDTEDVALQSLLEAASLALRNYVGGTGRFAESASGTRTYEVDGCVIYPDECTAVTAVTDANSNALTHRVVKNCDGSLVNWITLTVPHTGAVTVTGTFGTGIPADVARAAVITCGMWYRRNSTGGVDNSFVGRLEALPMEATQMLARYRMVRV